VQVLACGATLGYEEVFNTQVHKFNGTPVRNLRHLAEMVLACTETHMRFDVEYSVRVCVWGGGGGGWQARVRAGGQQRARWACCEIETQGVAPPAISIYSHSQNALSSIGGCMGWAAVRLA
jgi:hypothetical protein